MVASVLNSPQAVRMSLHVVRAFVTFARAIGEYKKLGAKIAVLETKVGKHDKELQQLLEAIRLLIAPPQLKKIAKSEVLEKKPTPTSSSTLPSAFIILS